MTHPIPARDVIALGGSFTIDKFDVSHLPRWAFEGNNIYRGEHLKTMDGQKVHVSFEDNRYSLLLLTPDQGEPCNLDLGTFFAGDPQRGRQRLAKFVKHMAPEAADALCVDFELPYDPTDRDRQVPLWDQSRLNDLGLDRDAGLFVAVAKGDVPAMLHYRDIGADPMRPSPDGDCAARLAVAAGYHIFSPDTYNAQHLQTGESGLHSLADRPGMMASFVREGADTFIQDVRGQSPLDHVDSRDRQEVLEAVAQWQQRQLEANTAPAIASWSPPAQDQGQGVEHRADAQHQRLRPQRL